MIVQTVVLLPTAPSPVIATESAVTLSSLGLRPHCAGGQRPRTLGQFLGSAQIEHPFLSVLLVMVMMPRSRCNILAPLRWFWENTFTSFYVRVDVIYSICTYKYIYLYIYKYITQCTNSLSFFGHGPFRTHTADACDDMLL